MIRRLLAAALILVIPAAARAEAPERWYPVESPTTEDLLAIHFSPEGAGFAVGAGGAVLRHDNGVFRAVAGPGAPVRFRAVASLGPDELWATTEGSLLYHYAAGRWTATQLDANFDAISIAFLSPRLGYTAGLFGMLYRYDGERWDRVHTPVLSSDRESHLNGVAIFAPDDVWVGGQMGFVLQPNVLYRNDGLGRFEAKELAHRDGGASLAWTFRALGADLDGDGRTDLFCVNSWGDGNTFYRQAEDGTFIDATRSSGLAGAVQHGVEADAGDVDGDGALDLIVTTVPPFGPSRLYRNDGRGHFRDVTSASGIHEVFASASRPIFADMDLDGDTDLLVLSMDPRDPASPASPPAKVRLLLNDGRGHFTDVTGKTGVGLAAVNVLVEDFEEDGDLDIYLVRDQESNRLLVNHAPPGGWLKVAPRSPPPNRAALGARVSVYGPDGALLGVRETSWRRPVAHFGLGDADGVTVEVRFPGGRVARRGGVAKGQMLRPERVADPAGLRRFVREAEVGARLNHPGIVRVLGSGECRILEGRAWHTTAYLAMEWIEGALLASLLAGGARLPLSRALEIVRDAAEALASAHAAGVLHRDIKPDNLLLSRDGAVKIVDFGIAAVARSSERTDAGLIVGTLAYLPPERVEGRLEDARGDLYALGAVLYEAICGRRPFEGISDTASLLRAIVAESPAPPSSLREGISPGLSALILALLAKDPASRPGSAREVAEALDGALREIRGEALAESVRAAPPVFLEEPPPPLPRAPEPEKERVTLEMPPPSDLSTADDTCRQP